MNKESDYHGSLVAYGVSEENVVKFGTAETLCKAPVWESMKREIQTHLTFMKLWQKE